MHLGRTIEPNSVDQTTIIQVINIASGAPELNLTASTESLLAQYIRLDDWETASPTLVAINYDDPHTDGGFVHLGGGLYRFDLPDAAVVEDSSGVLVQFFHDVDTTYLFDVPFHPLAAVASSGDSGGGFLRGRISAPNLAPNEYLDVVQGEAKTLTFIIEAEGRFNSAVATDIEIKIEDSSGTVVTIENDDITRVCEELDIQVLRATLTATDSESLETGLAKVQISFDTQRSVIANSLRIIEGI